MRIICYLVLHSQIIHLYPLLSTLASQFDVITRVWEKFFFFMTYYRWDSFFLYFYLLNVYVLVKLRTVKPYRQRDTVFLSYSRCIEEYVVSYIIIIQFILFFHSTKNLYISYKKNYILVNIYILNVLKYLCLYYILNYPSFYHLFFFLHNDRYNSEL